MSSQAIRQSASAGQLLVILGAGVSMSLTPKSKSALSWPGLTKSGLDYAHARGLINEAQSARHKEALSSDDIDDLLGVAEFVSRKLGAPDGEQYARWIRSVFEDWKAEAGGMQNALRALAASKIPIATLNYDTLAEECTSLHPVEFNDTQYLLPWSRKEKTGILHLHGVWTNPKNCVFSIRDYERTLTDEVRLLIQRSFSSMNRLLFIGCGDTFADPNFLGLISWLRSNLGANMPQHYALVRNSEVPKRLSDPTWRGFVEPLGYGDHHTELPGFLLTCFPSRSGRGRASKVQAAALKAEQVIDSYRRFLIRDSGEMTIEGMRADMDTAQRKFEIEKIFVPLDVAALPPDIPDADPDKHKKLAKWNQEHQEHSSFAKVFSSEKRIALLALPGGGKTLLLKRLAVAYANPLRLEASRDGLPPLDLVPLMIRCREWKDHIRKPISILLQEMPAITGELDLRNLAESLEKVLRSGAVLLLVDGLDEIHDDADRTIFVENLERFLDMYPKIRLLVTSREAGFDLIAPHLSRFCKKYRIAPLNDEAIISLCDHWHKLMSGSNNESAAEAASVASNLIHGAPLRRLAENPLLCTMLLVVKHGFGRLPPDRATLYERAVEILLNTWNIKGHEALKIKEAVPQLACVAYELLRRGKQTATEKEILSILTQAREEMPIIGRYAKDSPYDFLKRVELRSSLVLEGGHTSEDGKIVPFYQFRHLTFQEYLAAVAAVEGWALSSEHRASLLAALSDDLISDEWKEVVPMAAVLAKSQAAPLLDRLAEMAEAEEQTSHADPDFGINFMHTSARLPPATGLVASAMTEEAIFNPAALAKSTHAVAYFAHGCSTSENWSALIQGPYGDDLRRDAISLYFDDEVYNRGFSRNTVALMEAHARGPGFWKDSKCGAVIASTLGDSADASITRALLSICGSFWLYDEESSILGSSETYEAVEGLLNHSNVRVRLAAAWAWGFWRYIRIKHRQFTPAPCKDILSYLVHYYLSGEEHSDEFSRLTISRLIGVPRSSLELDLTLEEHKALTNLLHNQQEVDPSEFIAPIVLAVRVAYILKGKFSDEDLVRVVTDGDNFEMIVSAGSGDIVTALGLRVEETKSRSRGKVGRKRTS